MMRSLTAVAMLALVACHSPTEPMPSRTVASEASQSRPRSRVVQHPDGVVTPPCASPAPLFLSVEPAPGWLVEFKPGTDVDSTMTRLRATYPINVQVVWKNTILGFYGLMTPDVVAALRCDSAVSFIEQNGYGHIAQ
jgi:hypothetical protein